MSEVNRKIIARIKALHAKTVARGATEAEASSAADAAHRLMTEHQIDDAGIESANYDRNILPLKGVKLTLGASHPFVHVCGGVSHLTGCKCFLSDVGMYVVGDDVGRALAEYLFDMTRNVMEASWSRERKRREDQANDLWVKINRESMPKAGRRSKSVHVVLREIGLAFDGHARKSFMLGMAYRMTERMCDMPPARQIPADVVEKLMSDKVEHETRGKPMATKALDMSAVRSGQNAGNGVSISFGVGAQSEVLKLGG